MIDRDVALGRVLADACLGANEADALTHDLRGFLARHGVAAEDVEAIASAPKRLGVYRTLIRNGLSAVVLRMLPRTRARMNAACANRFDADFARFVDEVGPRTHYLRDVPAEFFAWAAPRWRESAEVPAYLIDLATHELAQFAIAASDADSAARAASHAGDIGLDRALVFSGSMRLLRYAWAVHELEGAAEGESAQGPPEPPARRDVHLLGYRDEGHDVRWLELTPLAAAIVHRLERGEQLGDAILGACAEKDAPADPPAIARLLADLAERGVLVGPGG